MIWLSSTVLLRTTVCLLYVRVCAAFQRLVSASSFVRFFFSSSAMLSRSCRCSWFVLETPLLLVGSVYAVQLKMPCMQSKQQVEERYLPTGKIDRTQNYGLGKL